VALGEELPDGSFGYPFGRLRCVRYEARQLAETRVQQRIAHRLRVLVLAHRAKLELAYQAADCAASGGTATGVLPMPQWAETTQQVRRRTAEPDPEPSPCPRHRANQWR